MGEYWFSEVKFQSLRSTSGVAVKLSEWTRDIGVVTRNVVFVGKLWRMLVSRSQTAYLVKAVWLRETRQTSYTKKKPTSPVHCLTMMSTLIYRRTQKTSRTLIQKGACII